MARLKCWMGHNQYNSLPVAVVDLGKSGRQNAQHVARSSPRWSIFNDTKGAVSDVLPQ